MDFTIDINHIRKSFEIIFCYIHKINEEFLKENITGYIYKDLITYRDPDRNWFAKDFCPQINMLSQSIIEEDQVHRLYIKNTKIQDKYIESILDNFRICTKDDPYDEYGDNVRLSEYIDEWKTRIPSIYDKEEHLKRLVWDVSLYFIKENSMREEIAFWANSILSPEKYLHLDEFRSNGMICKVIDFENSFVEIKAINGLWGEYTRYCKSTPLIPNSPEVKIPKEVYSPCCNTYLVRYLGKGLFDNLARTETIILPVSLKKCEWSFWRCKKLKSITVDGYGWEIQGYDGVLYDNNKKRLIAYPNCHGSEYYVPDGVEVLEKCSFKDCDNIRKLHLPKTLKRIGLNAFYRCYNLEEIICDFKENDVEFEGYYGEYGNINPRWIFRH